MLPNLAPLLEAIHPLSLPHLCIFQWGFYAPVCVQISNCRPYGAHTASTRDQL